MDIIKDNGVVSASCPACGGRLQLIRARSDIFSYYQCCDCSLVTSLPVPSAKEIAEFYNGFLFGVPRNDEHESKLKGYRQRVENILGDCLKIGNIAPPLRVLDWGGGVGYYANAFSECGCECTLIDIDSKACEFARSTFPDKFLVVNEDPVLHLFPDRFDLVFCNQVIEHHPDAVSLLKAIHRLVLPDGLVIITTPNQQCKEFFFRHDWLKYYLMKTVQSRWQVASALLAFLRTPWICCDPPRHVHAFNHLLSSSGTWGNNLVAFAQPCR
jgi:SAM-dependent methyltransferase